MTDRILDALRDAGGERAMGELERELGSTKNTVRKHLQPLIDTGVVRTVGHGRYRLVGASPLTSDSGKALLSVLEDGDYDAHLTGFDVLVPYAHQFVFAYPHLINADPAVFDALAYELADDGFVVRGAGRGPALATSDASLVVVLRRQPNARQYRVHAHLAPPEKAWVDTLRETLRGNLELSHLELGRILRNLLDSGADVRYLRRYARQLGYLDCVEQTIEPHAQPDRPETHALRAGFHA